MKYLLPLWSIVRWLEVQKHRRQVYSAAVIALPLLTGASLLTEGQAQKILTVLALLSSAGVPALARRHTPKKPATINQKQV